MNKTLDDIFVTFTDKQLNKMLGKLARWCDEGGYLHDLVDPSDVFEQFKYLMEVREVALANEESEA
jgi:hypothetical protein